MKSFRQHVLQIAFEETVRIGLEQPVYLAGVGPVAIDNRLLVGLDNASVAQRQAEDVACQVAQDM